MTVFVAVELIEHHHQLDRELLPCDLASRLLHVRAGQPWPELIQANKPLKDPLLACSDPPGGCTIRFDGPAAAEPG